MSIRSLIGMMAVFALLASPAAGADLKRLRVLQDQYPRAYFFRAAEGQAANRRVSYERWEKAFQRLMGIQGKVLEEEVPGRSIRNIDFFTRFKQNHPDQLVLLHYNGNARDPRFETARFFAGHWIYYNGAKILADVPAEAGQTDIAVDNPALFRMQIGRYRNANEDIGLCMLDDQGRPDWHRSEQVQLVSVDTGKRTIRVRRGCYGTEPRGFPAGKSYAAAHVTEGPWGRRSNIMWYYNHSTRCPVDSRGQTCTDVHIAELAKRFSPSGCLHAFDGIQFDVFHHEVGRHGSRAPDCDADGLPDSGWFPTPAAGGDESGSRNEYGIGVIEFFTKLREKLGEDRLILADGMSTRNQRAFGLLNGIESEGWPILSDWGIRDWSGGLNRHFYWSRVARPPALNYINHKFTTAGETPGSRVRPDVPSAVHRLVFAVAAMTDAAVCYSTTPPLDRPGELIGIWDELRMGTENRVGWLGRPLAAPVRLATRQADVLDGAAVAPTEALLKRLDGEGMRFSIRNGRLIVAAEDASSERIEFTLRDVPCAGPDLFISLTAKAEAMRGYPSRMARMAWLGNAADRRQLTRREVPQTGICLRGGNEQSLDRETGASVRWNRELRIGDVACEAFSVHPPYRDGVGYTFWLRDVRVPAGGRLQFYTGMGPKSPQRSDGVAFRVLVRPLGVPEAEWQPIFEHVQKSHEWIAHRVSLDKWAGRNLQLKFVADCGPADNATTDHASWGDVLVLAAGEKSLPTRPLRWMTWCGREDFTSGFYFSDLRTAKVDCRISVEGGEPLSIGALTAHQYPDAMFRVFENGLVLANPSPRPFTFHLWQLVPGKRFRRLRGSQKQDPLANNGAVVGQSVTLEGKEGLFLVRLPE